MNKYSKRALKTTATVGMSLAMVLSAAAPVMALTPGMYELKGVCKDVPTKDTVADAGEIVTCGQTVYLQVLSKLDGKKLSEVNVESGLKLTGGDDKSKNIFAIIEEYKAELTAAVADGSMSYSEKATITGWLNTTKEIEAYLGAGSLTTLEATDSSILHVVTKNVNGEVPATDWSTITSTNVGDARTALKALKEFKSDYGKYLGINSDDDYASNELATEVVETYLMLNNNINEYLGVTADSDLTDFVITFDAILQADLEGKAVDGAFLSKTVSKDDNAKEFGAVLGGDGAAVTSVSPTTLALNNKSNIKNRINLIKDHTAYDRFKDEDSVIAILDAYQELLDNIGATSDVLKSDEYNAYIKTKISNVANSNKVTLKAFTKDFTDASAAINADALAAVLNGEQFAILKAAKEEVMDAIYTMETREVSGRYYVDKSDYNSNATSSQRTTFNNTFADYLYTLVDKEEGLFGYDVVANHMDAVASAIVAATSDINKLTPANIKAADKAKLETAEDAIYELVDGDFKDNLTSAEKRTLRAADTKITNLREAFDNLGTTTAAGWYDKGNGNWGYNNEDGTPATKWVAAGSDWYYVKGGNMLRNAWIAENASGARWYYVNDKGVMVTNTVVDGYTIDANGIWTK